MSLDGNARAQVQYSQTPGLSQLNTAEKQRLMAALSAIWGADTTYLVTNAVVTPATMNVAGLPTAGSPSAQTITPPGLVAGTGTIG